MDTKEKQNTLFVRNLPAVAAKLDLESHFGGVGPLRHTVVVTEPGTEKCKGIGFVTFAFKEDAQKALKSLDGSYIRGRKVSLDIAKKRQRREDNDVETAVPYKKQKREHVKRKGAKQGSLAMRTVLITSAKKNSQLTEDEAKEAVAADSEGTGFESCVMSANSCEARCTFSSWALAGKAAALAHGLKYHASIEALKGGKRTTVIVRNLPFVIDETELRSQFETIAPIRDLRLAPGKDLRAGADRRTKSKKPPTQEEVKENDEDSANQSESFAGSASVRCGGFAFIEYFLVAHAKFAIAKLNGNKIGGRVVAVDLALERTAYEAQDEDGEGAGESEAQTDNNDKPTEDTDDRLDVDKTADAEELSQSNSREAYQEAEINNPINDDRQPTKKEGVSTEEELSRTVFVRNLLFETSARELRQAIESEFGAVEQAVLVTHPVTKRPRGTGFVRFASAASAKKAAEQAGEGDTSKQEGKNTHAFSADQKASGFWLQGRQLMISPAVDKSKAKKFEQSTKQKKDDDPRNLRLAWIGMIKADSPEARGLSQEDLARRMKAVKEKRIKLERNPNVFVSEVRLCVRNLPKDFDEKLLKHMFLCASQEKAVSSSKKEINATASDNGDSSKEVRGKKGNELRVSRITHVAVVRDPQRNDRSKGYGFVQYEQHSDALRALQIINNKPKAMEWLIKQRPRGLKIDAQKERLLRKLWGDGRRLMVEFALEDVRKVQKIERIKERGRRLAEENKRKRNEAADGTSDGERRKRQRKTTGYDGAHALEGSTNPDQKLTKSEKRAALKQERAKVLNKKLQRENRKKNVSTAQKEQSKKTKEGSEKVKLKEDFKPSNRQQDVERMKAVERPDPKPKKPKKKTKAAEVEKNNKFDRLLLNYTQKLAKTGPVKIGLEEAGTTGAAGARPRWFE